MASLSDLYRHNLWANLALVDHLAKLTDEQLDAVVPGTFGSSRATLMHLAGAEKRYVQRLRGQERTAIPDEFPGFDAVRASLEETGSAFIGFADTLDGAATTHADFDGQRWTVENRVVLVQAINHATEHRAHIMTSITANGADGLELDGWMWGEVSGAARTTAIDS